MAIPWLTWSAPGESSNTYLESIYKTFQAGKKENVTELLSRRCVQADILKERCRTGLAFVHSYRLRTLCPDTNRCYVRPLGFLLEKNCLHGLLFFLDMAGTMLRSSFPDVSNENRSNFKTISILLNKFRTGVSRAAAKTGL